MATYVNNAGTLECSGTDVTSAGIYAALIAESIGTGHVQETGGSIDFYVFNAKIRIMSGAIWDFSNELVKIGNFAFEIYGSVFSGSESGGTSAGGGGFLHMGASSDLFRLFDGAAFKMYGGFIYATRRVRVDANTEFWAIDCDGQLLDSVSAGETASYGANQDIRYDRSRLHDSSGVGVKLYSFDNATFSLSKTKIESCLYAFQVGNPAFLAPVLFDVEIDSCDFHVVGNMGDIDITFINPDFTVYRPSTIGLTSADVARVAFRYELHVLDAANSPISGAAVIVRDGAGAVQSNSSTDASGSVSDLPTYGGQTVLLNSTNAGATRTDRSVTTRSICKYGYLIRQDTFTVNADFIDNVNLVANQQIALTEASAGALTEVSTPAEALAAINKYIQDNYNEEPELPAFIDDGLNCRGNTVVFDATAAQVVDYSGGTLTLKSTLFEGLVITTSTVSAVNGAVQTGGIIDSNGDSFLSFEAVDSWIVYASAANRDTNTSPLAVGTGSEIYRFTFSGGTTYYLRLTTGTDIIFKDATPITSGETLVSLGTSALLGNINASIQESSQLAEYDGRVTVDLISGTNSTEYPFGTSKTPTSTIANALIIADDIGVKAIEVRGSSSALPQELNGYELMAGVTDSVGAKLLPQLSLTPVNGADNCEFRGFELTGATDVTTLVFGNLYESCLLNGVAGLTGVSRNCKLAGTLQVEHAVDVQGSYGTVDFSVSGTNARLTVPDFSGSMTLSGMASATAVAIIGVVSGIVTIDATCSAGTIVVANADQVVDNSTGASVTILQDTGGGGGGDSAAAIYTYFTAGTRADAFKADVSAIPANPLLTNDARLDRLDVNISTRLASASYVMPPTVGDIDTQLSVAHGVGSWATATGFSTLDGAGVQVALAAYGASTFNPVTDTVARVSLVDVCALNADMRGTDGANTVAPDNTTIASTSVVVELLAQYHDNDSGLFLADGVTPATLLTAETIVTFGTDGTTPLKTVRVLDTDGNPTTLPNWSRYEKI